MASRTIHIRIDDEDHAELERRADAFAIPVSTYARSILVSLLRSNAPLAHPTVINEAPASKEVTPRFKR